MASMGLCLSGEDRVDGFSVAPECPSPAGGQGLDDVQAAPVLQVGRRGADDGGIAGGVGDDDRHGPGSLYADHFQPDRRRNLST